MANTTFSGPVRSLNGFISFGPKAVVSLTADTTLTVADHAGRVITCNDADGKFTLPTITVGSSSAVAGANDYNVASNLGCTYTFWVETAATDMDIKTDGTDKFVGAIMLAVDDGAKKAFIPAAANDVITMTGSTAGGLVGSVLTITAIADDQYLVHDSLVLATGTIVTPFANS